MKKCPNCNRTDVEFSKHSKRTDGLQVYCKICCKEMNAAHYRNGYRKVQSLINKNRRNKIKSKINNYKNSIGCPCGEKEACCLDFHHTGKDKERNISRMVCEQAAWEKVELEIRKCVVVCSNCHRKIHAKKYPTWYLWSVSPGSEASLQN